MTAVTTRILSRDENRGYGQQPIPTNRDEEIASLLNSCPIEALTVEIADEHHAVLMVYAERMASYAVRCQDPSILRSGLIALALAGVGTGNRDAMTIMPVCYDAARRIGMVPDGLFRSVGESVGGTAEAEFERFLRRAERDKSLAAMGYRVGGDQQGFRYEREW